MKTNFFLLTFLMTGYFAFAQYTAIPDPNFENALSAYDDIPNDGQVPTANINTVTSLDVWGQNISDLTGIEDFTALQILTCSTNLLTNIDVSQNIALQELNCIDNQLTILDISQNTSLQYLYCDSNQLTSLDVSNNSGLLWISCHLNQLSSLDTSQNVALQLLKCEYNQLTSLDVSQNTDLHILEISNNQLTSLNVQNGNNINFVNFDVTNNPNLYCIQVDDPAWSAANWTSIDPQASFNHNCSNPETYVPDDNFENYLETHDANGITVPLGDPFSMGNGIANDDYVTTANINTVTSLNVSYQNIFNLTGIEDFTALQNLYCQNNQLTSFDVSQNTALQVLGCSYNQLTNINVSQNITLHTLSCGANQLTSLDVSQNTGLLWISCELNQLTSIDISQNVVLQVLRCEYNLLTSLDVSQNTALSDLYCSDNQLTALNVQNGNNINFTSFNATNNPNLTCIFVDDAAWSNANWTNIDTTATFVETQAECDALSVEDVALTGFTIYPNPVQDIFTIKSDVAGRVALYSLTGKHLLTQKLKQGENQVHIGQLNQGVYFVKIQSGKQTANFKIVKK